MTISYERKTVVAVLLALLLIDVALTTCGYCFPDLWFSIFHGTPYNDPEGFLRRCAGNWLMFCVLQAIALWRWEKKTVWLAIVAGARFSDMLTDWSYLAFSQHLTTLGGAALLSAGPMNLIVGLYLFKAFRVFSGRAS